MQQIFSYQFFLFIVFQLLVIAIGDSIRFMKKWKFSKKHAIKKIYLTCKMNKLNNTTDHIN